MRNLSMCHRLLGRRHLMRAWSKQRFSDYRPLPPRPAYAPRPKKLPIAQWRQMQKRRLGGIYSPRLGEQAPVCHRRAPANATQSVRMFGTGTMSTDTQANQPSGPVDDFAARIAQHRVAGYGRHTIIAWLLYALVVTDALLNAMGSGAVTMSILDTIAEGVSLDGKTLTFVL